MTDQPTSHPLSSPPLPGEGAPSDAALPLPASRLPSPPPSVPAPPRRRRGRPSRAELKREAEDLEMDIGGDPPERLPSRRPAVLRREVTREEVVEAIPESYGLATEIAERLCCTIDAVNAVLDEHYDDVERALEAESDHQEDLIIKSIIDDAKSGDSKARELFLKTLARRHSTSSGGGRGGPQISVKFNMPEPPSVTPETKAQAIGEWSRAAQDFHREQEARAAGASVEMLLSDATRLRAIPPEGGR